MSDEKATEPADEQLEELRNTPEFTDADSGLPPASSESAPLPQDHWLLIDPDGLDVPPMPLRSGAHSLARAIMAARVRAAARYALRATTRCGRTDVDPDALLQNLTIGLFGYETPDGLSSEPGLNPSATPPEWGGEDLKLLPGEFRLEGNVVRANFDGHECLFGAFRWILDPGAPAER